MKVIALIGARSGSKSVPDKNIRPLAGHPLLAYSIKAAQKLGLPTYFSSDSAHYRHIASRYGALAIDRPHALAGDTSTDFTFIRHALYSFAEPPDIIVHLRPTTPLREASTMQNALLLMRNSPDATALRSVHEMPESALKSCKIDEESGHLKTLFNAEDLDFINDPRQSFVKTYHPNGYIDILRTDFIYKRDLIHGGRVKAFVTEPVTEVDSEEDFELLEWRISKHPELVTRLFS